MTILRNNLTYFIVLSILISQTILSKMGRAEIFNVSNEAELRGALFSAENNGEDDTINVAPGTYETGGAPFSYEAVASENSSISLLGAGAGLTILEGENLDRVLIIDTNSVTDDSDTEIKIKSLTLQNGNSTRAAGGLNIISKSATVNLENCEIQNNSASSSGGGASIIGKSVMIMTCKFTNNATASLGGGVFIDAATVTLNGNTVINNASAGPGGGINIFNAESAALSDNTFENNTSTASDGGAASIHADNVTLPRNNTFISNSAQNNGGAIFITEALNANLTHNLFQNNSANEIGGGVYLKASSQITVSNNTLDGNGSGLDGGGSYTQGDGNVNLNANLFMNNISNRNGGGACVDSNNGILTNNIFLNNGSINSGGAAYMLGAVSNAINNTMILNSTAGNGGGLAVGLVNETDAANIYNNIIFNNTSQTRGHDDIFVDDDKRFSQLGSFVNLFNNDFSEFVSSCENTLGCSPRINRGNNISSDPQFVDSQAGDVHLMENSPAIDAGDANAPDIPPADFDEHPRIQGPAPDMGALEFAGPVPPADVSIEKTSNVVSIPPKRESEITYTIRIENVGEEDATEVSIVDNLPQGSTIGGLTPGCTETQPGRVNCEVGTLFTGEQRMFEITVTITPDTQTIINQAIINFDNTVKMTSLTIPVVSTPNVSIEKSSNVSTVRRGRPSQITYTIRIESDGDGEAQDVVVTDDLPDGSTLVGASEGCSEGESGVVECEIGSLPDGEERNLEITLEITPQAATIINQATVEFPGGQNSDYLTIDVTGGGSPGGGCSLGSGRGEFGSLSMIGVILLFPLLLTGLRFFRRKTSG